MPLVRVMASGAGRGLGAGRNFGIIRDFDMSEAIKAKRPGDYAIVTAQAGADSRHRNSSVDLGNVLHVATVTIRLSWRAFSCAHDDWEGQQQGNNRGLHGRTIGTVVPSFIYRSPDIGRRGALCSIDQRNRIGPANRTTDPTTVTPALVYDRLLAGSTPREGAKLALAEAFTAAVTHVRIDLPYILGPKHERNTMRQRKPHGPAVGAIAVTNPADERRLKRPHRVA